MIRGDRHDMQLDWRHRAGRPSIQRTTAVMTLPVEGAMSNGSRPMMTQGLHMIQRVALQLTPLMTPVLRRSRDHRPARDDDDDDAPWREPRFTRS
jgi:hypothetical protein